MMTIAKNEEVKDVLIVGAGKIGTIRANIVRKLSPKSRIYLYDADYKKAQALASQVNGIALEKINIGFENKDIKIVIISVINKFGKDFCIQAFKHGKDVLLEKPMGRNASESQEIFKAAKKYKKHFKCGFNHRYHPAILEAKKLCDSKVIGELLFIRAAYGHGGRKGYEKEWRASKDLSGGGELLDQGCHLIDLVLWFFKFDTVKNISGIARSMFYPMEVDDNAFCLFETKGGKVAQIHASWIQWKNLFRFEIYGKKGSIEVNGLGKSYGAETLKVSLRKNPGKPPVITEKKFKEEDLSWELEWKDFLNKKSMSNEKESLEVMRVINKLYKGNS